jgi:hypothetical protein
MAVSPFVLALLPDKIAQNSKRNPEHVIMTRIVGSMSYS